MSRVCAIVALILIVACAGCGGGSSLLPLAGGTGSQAGVNAGGSGGAPAAPAGGGGGGASPADRAVAPAPGFAGGSAAIAPPPPGPGLPLPPAPYVVSTTVGNGTGTGGTGMGTGAGGAQGNGSGAGGSGGGWVNLGAFSLPQNLPGTIPPQPANLAQVLQRYNAKGASAVKSASDANLNVADPYGPRTLTALGQFAPPYGGPCYGFLTSDDLSTPGFVETFNAQHLSGGNTELHVWGAVTASNIQDMIYAQLGLVTQFTYDFARDPNNDGNLADGVPSYMFNQNVDLLNALSPAMLPFCAPLDFNGTAGLGFARGYMGNAFDFDLRLVPDQSAGGAGGLCWVRIRPRLFPMQPAWSAYAGDALNPATGLPYGVNNWGWLPAEDFSQALIIAQIYSYNATGTPGSITYQWVRATEGPLSPPAVDCRALTNARFLLASAGGDGAQGTGDDYALTGFSSTNTPVNAEPVLYLGDRFYVFFDNDPAQVNDKELYPSVPAPGLVQYTTTGLLADPALAAYFDLPDAVPGDPTRVYSAAHPFTLTLRAGAYNRIENDLRSLSWAQYSIITPPPGALLITGPWDTNTSNADRVILAQGVRYLPLYSALAYAQAGSYPPPGGFGAAESIYPVAHATGYIQVGYGNLSEGGTVLGGYYNQAGLVNALQADAYCRFETRTNWGAAPLYGMADFDLLAWISLPTLDPRSQPWNTMVYARGTNFFLQTADASVSPVVNVAAGRQLDAGGGPVGAVNFATAGGGGPYNGSFNVLPVRVYDDPAASDPDANVTRLAGAPPLWDVVVNFLLQYGAGPYTVELDSDYNGTWASPPAGRVIQIDGDPATPGIQTFAAAGQTYSRTVRIPNTHPAGGFTFAIRVTDSLGAQYVYAWANTVWLFGPPTINATALSNARFTLHRPNGSVLSANIDTDANFNANGLILLGDSFYVDFQLDAAASPNDRALYPSRPSVAGVVQYTAQGMIIDPALQPYFDTSQFGYQLRLRPGAYNRIENDLSSLRWANYSIVDAAGPVIYGPLATNASAADRVVLRANVQYRPRLATLPYPTTGSSTRAETIYPLEWTTGSINVGFGALAEGGTVLGGYFDQAGLVNTLQADAFCRFECEATALGLATYGFNDVNTGLAIVPVSLDPAARPYDVMAFARGTLFLARDVWGDTSANVSVDPGGS